jgi:hypothetical protein
MFKEYDEYDAVVWRSWCARAVSPEQLLDAAITRVEERDTAIHAVVNRLYDNARAAIRAGSRTGRSVACRSCSRICMRCTAVR